MIAILTLGTQTCDADITTPCSAFSKSSPASAIAPHCRGMSLACNTLAITGQYKPINTMILGGISV
jgi:hypothetical protein